MAARPAPFTSNPVSPAGLAFLRNTALLVVLIGVPLVAFLLVLHRAVPMAPLTGMDVKCAVCERRATRTLRRAAEEMRAKGIYVYDTSEYPGGIPAWCDLHGPDRVRENSYKAYLAALFAFAAVGSAYQKIRGPV